MEAILLLMALLFLVWRLKKANYESFSSYRDIGDSHGSDTHDLSSFGSTHSGDDDWHTSTSYGGTYYEDECDMSRALWDPTCPLYHSLSSDSSLWDNDSTVGDCDSWSFWDSSCDSCGGWDSWSSNTWD